MDFSTEEVVVRVDEKLYPANAETMANYYKFAGIGDFAGTLDTLSDDVFFQISGNPEKLPFAGYWSGKEKVKQLFTAFGSSFRLLSLNELQVVESNNRIHSFNDEAFFVYKTNRYYRVPVLHTLNFNDNHKISSLVNIHDTTAAIAAFSGADPQLVPINADKRPDSEEDTATSDSQNNDVRRKQMASIAKDVLELIFQGKQRDTSITEDVTLYIPGKPTRDHISGVWTLDELKKVYPKSLEQFFNESKFDVSQLNLREITANNGYVIIDGDMSDRERVNWTILGVLNQENRITSASLYLDFENL